MSERFFVDAIGSNETVTLSGEEAHHLARVRRVRRGELVQIFDGSGIEAIAMVRDIAKDIVSLAIEERRQVNRELPFRLTLACSPAKGERLRWLVEKATELGVTQFIPLLTQRSSEQARSVRAEKMKRWVIEGAKQCGRNILMELSEPIGWANFLDRFESTPTRLVAHPGGVPLSTAICQSRPNETVLAVGPEGGFAEEELQAAAAQNWTLVSLGRRMLRVETAAIALVARVVGDN
jgi:16S rRNA (uracil1498-N3)-methyltransferase